MLNILCDSDSLPYSTRVYAQLGAFVAATRDLEFDLMAYANVMVYNLLTALYLVQISKTKVKGYTQWLWPGLR